MRILYFYGLVVDLSQVLDLKVNFIIEKFLFLKNPEPPWMFQCLPVVKIICNIKEIRLV